MSEASTSSEAFEPPYRFERTHQAAEVVEGWSSLEPGEESGVDVAVAGRLMLLRPQGKLAFAELRDASGAVQLFALAAVTEEFEAFTKVNLGDWVGAVGEVSARGSALCSKASTATWKPIVSASRRAASAISPSKSGR